MTIAQRLKKIMEGKELSVHEFSTILNQSDKSIYNYLSGKTTPKWDVAEAVIRAFPEVNGMWLLTGEGEMWEKDRLQEIARAQDDQTAVAEKMQQFGEKIRDLERIIESNERTIKNQQEMIEMLRSTKG